MTADPGDRTPPAPPTGTSPTLRAERSLLQRAASDPEALLAALLRSKSVRGRVLAAHLVAAGADPRTLESLGRAVLDPAGAERALAELRALGADAEGLATYAWLCAIQTGAPQDTDAAMGLFEAAHTLSGGEQPAGRRAGVWTQLLVLAGRDERARDLLGTDRGSPEANAWAGVDLLNPHRAVPGHPAPRPGAANRAAVDAWLAAFNEQVTCHGIAPLRLADPSELFADGWLEQFGLRREEMFHTPFDHLATAPVEPVHDPFRVSIVMSTFNGGHELLLAARAIVAQSWQNWELFVVDDASPEPVPGVLEAVEALDPRITVVRKAVNGGTYRCRNTALRLATGDAFTVVDSDDWAHPQQLETLVGALVADPALVAAQANCLRIGEDLRVTRPGYTGRIMSRANLTVRMVPGVSRVGFFDPVRKAADTEYAQRLEAAFGVPPLRHPAPLTFLRTSDDSLSAGDFSPGWHHGSRAEYRAAFTPWHDRINQGLADPFFATADHGRSPPRTHGCRPPPVPVVPGGTWTLSSPPTGTARDRHSVRRPTASRPSSVPRGRSASSPWRTSGTCGGSSLRCTPPSSGHSPTARWRWCSLTAASRSTCSPSWPPGPCCSPLRWARPWPPGEWCWWVTPGTSGRRPGVPRWWRAPHGHCSGPPLRGSRGPPSNARSASRRTRPPGRSPRHPRERCCSRPGRAPGSTRAPAAVPCGSAGRRTPPATTCWSSGGTRTPWTTSWTRCSPWWTATPRTPRCSRRP
ncbi:hypothetical protein BJF82_10105 [Kytococcus sp. CUA-901]|nr:hypothetical protein BJF82_10105 [Kytococcus sp. CUA-901]